MKKASSFLILFGLIKQWRSQLLLIVIQFILIIPLSLSLLVLVPYFIQTINSEPSDLSWQRLLGTNISNFISPLFQNTAFEQSIPLDFQRTWFPLIFVLIAGMVAFLTFYSDFLLRDLSEKLACKLRSKIVRKYLSLNYFSAISVDNGLLSSMIGEDIRETLQSFTRLVSSTLKDGLTCIVFLVWLVMLDEKLFFIFLTVLIPAGIVLRVTRKILKNLSRQGLKFESELLSGLLERMRGWQTIQVHKAISFEINNFNKINNKIYHVWRRATRANALGTPLVEWLVIIAGSFIIIAALRRISDGTLTSQVLVGFMVTVGFLSDKINRMAAQFNSTRKGIEALYRINEFLHSNLTQRNVNLEATFNAENKYYTQVETIEFKDLSIGNSKDAILTEHVNLKLTKGALLVVVGPSGSGKSTLIRTVLGIQKPILGEILINGITPNETNFLDLSHDICFVPQEPFLFSGTIFENIVYPLKISNTDQIANSKANQALSLALLDKNLNDNISGLSGGEKQRLMFARIFFRKPSFIVIDEGTSAIDLNNELKLIHNLKEHISNAVTLVVAHRPAIKDYATDILDFSNLKLT